jgi:hypothetical protein
MQRAVWISIKVAVVALAALALIGGAIWSFHTGDDPSRPQFLAQPRN